MVDSRPMPTGRIRDDAALGQHHGQRAGPERLCQRIALLRNLFRDRCKILHSADMHNQGIILRPAFGRVNFPGGLRIQRVSAQPVNSLRRKGDEAALSQDGAGAPDHIRIDPVFIQHNIFSLHLIILSVCAARLRAYRFI